MNDIILYTTEDGRSQVQLRADQNMVWLTQLEMAELFDATKQNISLHLRNIFEEGELEPSATVKESLTVQIEGSRKVRRPVTLYNLDAILAVGRLGAICQWSFFIFHWKEGVLSQANELEDRLIDFAVRIITLAAKHIARQILRSGTSPAPNYAEARGAESNADFIHKLKIALKELNETSVWLRMICRANLMKVPLMEDLTNENQQLCRILNASVKTAKQEQPQQ